MQNSSDSRIKFNFIFKSEKMFISHHEMKNIASIENHHLRLIYLVLKLPLFTRKNSRLANQFDNLYKLSPGWKGA